MLMAQLKGGYHRTLALLENEINLSVVAYIFHFANRLVQSTDIPLLESAVNYSAIHRA